MRKSQLASLLISALLISGLLTGCASTAPTTFYRPANYSGEPYRISGTLSPMSGWNGVVEITINDQVVINKPLPVFSNTIDATGSYNGKKVTATITKVINFTSSYHRADVFIGSEKAATLTF